MGACQGICGDLYSEYGEYNVQKNFTHSNVRNNLFQYNFDQIHNPLNKEDTMSSQNNKLREEEDSQGKLKQFNNFQNHNSSTSSFHKEFRYMKKIENNIIYKGLFTPEGYIIPNYLKIIWNNGEQYIGQVYDQYTIKGIGIYQKLSGWIFMGEFLSNKIEGYGNEIYNKSTFYEGEFVNNKKEGCGIVYIDKENEYRGEMRDDSINGIGTLYKGINKKIEMLGLFKENELWEIGVYIDLEKEIMYEGEITKDGIFQGFGVLYDGKEKIIYIGNFDNAKLNGDCVIIEVINNRREVKKCRFIQGKYELELDEKYSTIYDNIIDSIDFVQAK